MLSCYCCKENIDVQMLSEHCQTDQHKKAILISENAHKCPCGGKRNHSHHESSLLHIKYLRETGQNIRHEQKFCECGGRYTSSGRSHHFNTKIHQKYENENNIDHDDFVRQCDEQLLNESRSHYKLMLQENNTTSKI